MKTTTGATTMLKKKDNKGKALAVIIADAHVDTAIWSGKPIYGDSQYAFRFAVEYACKRGVKALIGAGDMIDVRRPPSEVAKFLRGQISVLEKHKIDLLFIQGQHELADPPWLNAVHRHPKHIDHQRVKLGDISIYGLDWTPGDRLATELQNIPVGTNLLLCHQVWEEFMGELTMPEGTMTQVANATTVVTGDYHKFEHVVDIRGSNMQELSIYSPGATNIRAIDEPEDHYLLVLYEDGSITKKPIPGRDIYHWHIDYLNINTTVANWKNFVRKLRTDLPDELRMPIIEVSYDIDKPDIKKRMKEVYGGLAHIFWKKLRPARTEEDEARRQASRQILKRGPAGVLDMVVPKNSKHYKSLLRLIQSPEPKAELLTMKKERGL